MTDGVLIRDYKKVKPIEDRLETVEYMKKFFSRPAFFRDYRSSILEKITIYAKQINADIFAIKKESPATTESDWYMEGTYYKLRE